MSYQLFDLQPQNKTESNQDFTGRSLGRTLARGAEAAVGLPGDIASGLFGLANTAGEYLTGKEKPLGTYEQLQERIPTVNNPQDIQNIVKSFGGNIDESDLLATSPVKPFPTSEQIKKNVTEPLTGEALKPQTSGEQAWDDIVGDTVALFSSPSSGAKSIVKSGVRALARSGISNAAKWATEAMTDSPFLGSVAKIGTNLLTGVYGARGQLNAIKEKSYEDAFKNLPKNTKINVKGTDDTFKDLYKTIAKGDNPEKDTMLERLNAFFNVVDKNGKAPVKDLINLKQGWNRWLQDKNLSKDARRLIRKGVQEVNNKIGEYGKTNTAFFTPYKVGEELTAGFNSQSLFQQVVKSHPKLEAAIKNPYVYSLLFHSGMKSLTAGKAAKYALPLLGLNEASKIIQLISKSPTALKHYGNMLKAAGRNNIPVLGKEMAAFDKSASKALNAYFKTDMQPTESQKGKYVLYN